MTSPSATRRARMRRSASSAKGPKGGLFGPSGRGRGTLGIASLHIIEPSADLFEAGVHDAPRPAPGPTRQPPWSTRCEHGHPSDQERRAWKPGEDDPENADRDHHPPDIARQICDPQHHLLVLGRCIHCRVGTKRAVRGRIPRISRSGDNLTGLIGRSHVPAHYFVAVAR
jgi:hypothetical protein